MSDRDKELDELQKEIRDGLKGEPTPAIDQGDKLFIGDGTACFINQDRQCGPECRAFDPTSNGETPMSCTIIANMRDINAGIMQLVRIGSLTKKQQNSRPAPVPPDPLGKNKR